MSDQSGPKGRYQVRYPDKHTPCCELPIWVKAAGITTESYTEFICYAPVRAALDSMRNGLEALAFHVWIQPSTDQGDFTLIATSAGVLDDPHFEAAVQRIADEAGATYHGCGFALANSSEKEIKALAAKHLDRDGGTASYFINGHPFEPSEDGDQRAELQIAHEEFTSMTLGRIEDLLRKPKSVRRHVERERKMMIEHCPDGAVRQRVRRMTYDQFTGYLIGFYERGLQSIEHMLSLGGDAQQVAAEVIEEALKPN